MTSLDDAWAWYQATRQNARLLARLASRYWDDLPWEDQLRYDAQFNALEPGRVLEQARHSLDALDDLAVLVLFSVFESVVRERVLAEVIPQLDHLLHPFLQAAADDVRQAVKDGSFFRVLEPFKATGRAGLIEEVNQVRRYRNWVAHGKRDRPPERVTPDQAHDRLNRFLEAFPT